MRKSPFFWQLTFKNEPDRQQCAQSRKSPKGDRSIHTNSQPHAVAKFPHVSDLLKTYFNLLMKMLNSQKE